MKIDPKQIIMKRINCKGCFSFGSSKSHVHKPSSYYQVMSSDLTERMTSPQAIMDKSPAITGVDPETGLTEEEMNSPKKVW